MEEDLLDIEHRTNYFVLNNRALARHHVGPITQQEEQDSSDDDDHNDDHGSKKNLDDSDSGGCDDRPDASEDEDSDDEEEPIFRPGLGDVEPVLQQEYMILHQRAQLANHVQVTGAHSPKVGDERTMKTSVDSQTTTTMSYGAGKPKTMRQPEISLTAAGVSPGQSTISAGGISSDPVVVGADLLAGRLATSAGGSNPVVVGADLLAGPQSNSAGGISSVPVVVGTDVSVGPQATNSVVRYPCVICCNHNKTYITQQRLEIHYTKYHPNYKITPDSVQNTSTSITTDGGVRVRLPCDKCKRTFIAAKTLSRHYKDFHAEHIRTDPFQHLHSTKGLQQTATVCQPVSSRFPCDLCNKTYISYKTLAKHYKDAHPLHERTDEYRYEHLLAAPEFVCDLCEKVFYQHNKIQAHVIACYRKWVTVPLPTSDYKKDPPRVQGPTDPKMANMCEVELFLHFMQPVFTHWIGNTNKKGRTLFSNVKFGKWIDMTFVSALRWLALYLAWGLSDTKALRDPWSTLNVLTNPFFKKQMPGYRFNQFLRASHFNDNYEDNLPGHRGDSSSANYDQGLKFFMLSDPGNGYVLNAILYCGKPWKYHKTLKSTAATVIALLTSENLMDKGLNYMGCCHIVFCDSFYSKFDLVEFLLQHDTYYCGTIVKARKVPAELKDKLTLDVIPRKMERGDHKVLYEHKGKMTLIAWLDNKLVYLVHSIPHIGQREFLIVRKQRFGVKWVSILLKCPEAIITYNKYMGGVDLSDQIIAQNKRHFRQHRWYVPVFFQLIEIAVLNGFCVYKWYHDVGDKKRSLLTKTFRLAVVQQLVQMANTIDIHSHTGTCDSVVASAMSSTGPSNLRSPLVPHDLPNVHSHSREQIRKIRLNQHHNHGLIPCTVGLCVAHKQRVRCRTCCYLCNVRLCCGNCYWLFHREENYLYDDTLLAGKPHCHTKLMF